LLTVILVGGVAWVGAHDLDPRKAINPAVKPVTVQVVSLDWKWLFILPDQGIASVNHLTVPVGTPISFELTSSGVMNSFFIPQLGSQIYTMSGMATHVQLQADHPGTYRGLSAQFSGDGFADMRFTVDAVPARAMGDDNARRWTRARRPNLCGAGQAERSGCTLHLSSGRSRSLQHDPEYRIVGRSAVHLTHSLRSEP
jgi:cytochrome o ubiquinol oxidase subunit 2